MPAKYDVNEVTRQFLQNRLTERPELMQEFTAAIRDSRAVMHLLTEIGENCLAHSMNPIQGLAFALTYGMSLGVLLEKERVRREKRMVV